ncbi:MAG: ribonuclease III [Firmicutes bacterium]|nr:ribonuclease III [Bacillota bacterium]MBQ2096038.1 ribonuclease III [Bacillota bacterium]MBQ2218462.1 ribonuclease III [Bacillota bacterium]
MREVDYKNYNSIALAFMGDAVYERFIRERILRSGKTGADKMHRAAVRYVKAAAQELSLREMLDVLTEDEQVVVHRARNHKITSKPKNADPLTYKMATAFEALLGYLYLSGQSERLAELMERAAQTVENN